MMVRSSLEKGGRGDVSWGWGARMIGEEAFEDSIKLLEHV